MLPGYLPTPEGWKDGRLSYWPICLRLRRGAFICVEWQVTMCDPIRQVTLRSSEMDFL